ncbi:aromatic ring-hydroxylating dioxygenase subunit alpha [Halioxenophilus sp. WMMB6]|uniref:aromatic ring-hydroxylating oxygenase subunit alpha n=1 Tax=Halioxenophilus sp. WMMB6 TaxID=3073815 RepID=UPI00295E67A2|nr:aromatic ring-hydroxylating dioxygenase subunit alpha [Halioxenophilus sp. WMMB6]
MTDEMANSLNQVPFRIDNPELIPTERYYREEFFKAEQEKLWPHVWQMACRLEEIPDQGDYTVYEILDKSVILVNSENGVKAYHNACRHRGVRLVHGPGSVAEAGFICPFHGWRFAPEGECTFVFGRNIFSEKLLAKEEIDLAPVRIEFWAGCAFINFDDDAPSLRECLGPVAERMDARYADKLRVDWWCGTVLPTNWKLAIEAFQEGYHVMQTHPQLLDKIYKGSRSYGPDGDGRVVNEDLAPQEVVIKTVEFLALLNEGMDGMVHKTEMAVIEKLKDIQVPDDPDLAFQLLYGTAYAEVARDAKERGVPIFDLLKVIQEVEFNAVEFMFPHFFLLPTFAAMSSYRIRPLTAETCLFEIWSLVIPPEGDEREPPSEPTMLPYHSAEFPEIPRQDYSNLPLQQKGLHNLQYMRIGKGGDGLPGEGMISNYQRLIDGYLAGLDRDRLAKASAVVNSGFDETILDIGF